MGKIEAEDPSFRMMGGTPDFLAGIVAANGKTFPSQIGNYKHGARTKEVIELRKFIKSRR